jgi:hypothetical protein
MQPRAVTYRAEIIGPLLQSISAGECCSAVGMSGVGKSNVLRHLLRSDVLRHHLNGQASTLRFVTFDTNMLAEWSPWGVFEGLTEALISALAAELPGDVSARLLAAHAQVLAAPGQATLAFRECAAALDILCAQWRIVLLFDEFDELFAQLPGIVLRNLRGLRDRHKYQLMYLTFSRQPLASLWDEADWDAIEPFVELLTLHEIGLKPLCDEDARAEAQHFAARHNRTFSAETESRIVALGGGHPALLRALAQTALDNEECIALECELLHRSPALRLECAKIWQQLNGDERDDMLRVAREPANGHPYTQTTLLKGLLRLRPRAAPAVFSPLFAAYLRTIGGPPPEGAAVPLLVDRQAGRVIYYGRDISAQLGKKERGLLFYLWDRHGQLCSFADLAEAVYPDDSQVYLEQNSEFERLRTLAGRLRRKLASLAPDQPELLTFYSGLGYRLGIPIDS